MKFKLLMTIVDTELSDQVRTAARKSGAFGATVLSSARGLSLDRSFGILGLEIFDRRDVVLVLTEERLVEFVVPAIIDAGKIDERVATGIILELSIEQAWGLSEHVQIVEKARLPIDPNPGS